MKIEKIIESINHIKPFSFTIVKKGTQVCVEVDHTKWLFQINYQSHILPNDFNTLLQDADRNIPTLIICEYIPKRLKQKCRTNGISYIESIGNIFICAKGLYIYHETTKSGRSQLLQQGHRAFTKTGVKVGYQLLIEPTLLLETYRVIAQKSTVTLDTVKRVIDDLLVQAYIVRKTKNEFQFVDIKRFFKDWVHTFNHNLRPKLKTAKFKLLKNTDFKELQLPKSCYWGGAVAEELLTNYLIADTALIYTHRPFMEVAKELKMIPSENGNITLSECFWDENQISNQQCVHPILIYADLVSTNNERYVEASQKIYLEYVKNQLQ